MTPDQFHSRIWDILKPIDEAYFEVVAASAPGREAVAAAEAIVGFPAPDAIVAFAQRTNGLCVDARDEAWPQAKLYAVGPAWTFWRGLVMLGFDTEDLPEWASITAVHQTLAEYEVRGVFPLLKVLGDGGRVWGVNASGETVLVQGGEVTQLDVDFSEVYAEQVAELIPRQHDIAQRTAQRSQ